MLRNGLLRFTFNALRGFWLIFKHFFPGFDLTRNDLEERMCLRLADGIDQWEPFRAANGDLSPQMDEFKLDLPCGHIDLPGG